MSGQFFFIVFIGLTSATLSFANNETQTTALSTTYDSVIDKNITNIENNTNTSVVEFFGGNEENSTTVDKNLINNPNITSKVEYIENRKKQKYRIRNYSGEPLHTNAQNQNPFVSGARGGRGRQGGGGGGGIDPQIVQLLQNNPRLRTLAEQNPEIAQQIFRNPRLLRDPRIQSNYFY